MEEQMNKDTECRACGVEYNFEETPDGSCPKCKSRKITRRVFVYEEITIHETLKLAKNNNNFPKKKNPRQETITGEDFFKKKGKWVKKERTIDKDNDIYKELIIDPDTGEIIYQCEEPLSKHRGHGSAKKDNQS